MTLRLLECQCFHHTSIAQKLQEGFDASCLRFVMKQLLQRKIQKHDWTKEKTYQRAKTTRLDSKSDGADFSRTPKNSASERSYSDTRAVDATMKMISTMTKHLRLEGT